MVFTEEELVVSVGLCFIWENVWLIKSPLRVVPCLDFEADSIQMSNPNHYLDLLSVGTHDNLRVDQ